MARKAEKRKLPVKELRLEVRKTRTRKIMRNVQPNRGNGKTLDFLLKAISGIPDLDSIDDSILDELPSSKLDEIRKNLEAAEKKIMALHDFFKN